MVRTAFGKRRIGPCCACGKDDRTVSNIVFFDFEGPAGFEGWGCVVCSLPPRGAVAVLCDSCRHLNAQPRFFCGGKYIGDRVRVEIATRTPFAHDAVKHGLADVEQHVHHGGWLS
jgi:hypothetical protein